MSNYSENETYNKWINKAVELTDKAVNYNKTMTAEELVDLRLKLSIVQMHITTDVLLPVSKQRTKAELHMEHLEGIQFNTYYNIAKDKKGEDGKALYTASTAETIARKSLKNKTTKYQIARKKWLEIKDFEQSLYQTLKALSQVCNALSKT